jgi:hypothetical protein
VSRATALLIGIALVAALVACDPEASPPPAATGAPPSLAASSAPSTGTTGIVPGCDPSLEGEGGRLTGVWEASDEGIYYLHHTADDCIWWFGTDIGRTTGRTFSNVAVGHLEGDVIRLQWADVPWGDLLNSGILSLRVSADGNTLTRIEATGGFGGQTWTRQLDVPSPGPSASP